MFAHTISYVRVDTTIALYLALGSQLFCHSRCRRETEDQLAFVFFQWYPLSVKKKTWTAVTITAAIIITIGTPGAAREIFKIILINDIVCREIKQWVVLKWIKRPVTLVNDQLDAQFFYFIIRLLQSSTCFEQRRAHYQEVKLICYSNAQ